MSLRTPITLGVLLGIVVSAGWYGWRQFDEPFENPFAGSSGVCEDRTVEAGDMLHRNQLLVNVYNAGTRNDLASSTLEDLVRIGFLRGVAANAPNRVDVHVVTVVDSDPSSAAVRLVRAQFQGRVRVADRPDLGDEGLDVFVGNGYLGLARHSPRAVRVRDDVDICVPPTTSPTALG